MDELGIIEEGVDWRTRLGQDIRDRVKRDILFSLQMKLQTTTSTTLIDLQKVAARIEERIYKIAIDFGDYLRRISLIKGDLDDSYPLMLNNFLHIHQQASTSSFFLLHQKNKQGQIIQAEGNVQGTSSSSHKEPSHPHGKDRISELPNDLIHHIMSFLSMKEAVRTSVLSHWWVNKWTCLQSIKLDINWFRLDREKFRSSIDKLLLSRDHLDAPMDTFQLDSFAVDRASSWINHAIKYNAKVVKFSEYPSWEPFYLDPELVDFSSRYLKTLELTNAALNEMVFDRLNNACPVLENLGQQTGSSSFTNSYLTFTTITLVDASDVTSIELTATDRQFTFVEQQGSRPMFRNLRTLRLGEWCMADNFLPLHQYVNHSPVLRKVFLKLSLVDWWSELTTNQLMALVEISSGGSISIDFY
uniref:Mediator complex subunit 15 KIX domain-containing protein n=1 Tax=Oryza barthii TaxID=65489 RepID=A0A0D3GZP0_9ORYZ